MTKHKFNYFMLLSLLLITFALFIGAKVIYIKTKFNLIDTINKTSITIFIIVFLILIIDYLFRNKIYKGFKYFLVYKSTINKLEKQLIDAEFYIKRYYYIEIPKMELSFENDLMTGKLKIINSIKFNRKLDDIVLSSGLGKYSVECHYLSNDENSYIYELIDSSISFKQEFKSLDDFLSYNSSVDKYKLFLDKRTQVKLQHSLIVGQTGSGKTYSLYSLILQMLNKSPKYELFIADPKGSSLSLVGDLISSDRTAVKIENIIDLLEEFVNHMEKRELELLNLLKSENNQDINADYSSFNLSPYIFIFDEYASASHTISKMNKETKDKVRDLMSKIVLLGRQLGFFMIITMQKSDSTTIDTTIRDNLPLKIVLSNAEQTTYITAFGNGIDIPNRNYDLGDGVFTEPVLAPTPKIVQFPILSFNIRQAVLKPPLCNNGGSRETTK